MPSFKLNARQQAIVDAADESARLAALEGHHAPHELVGRMTDEQRAAVLLTPRPARQSRPSKYHLALLRAALAVSGSWRAMETSVSHLFHSDKESKSRPVK